MTQTEVKISDVNAVMLTMERDVWPLKAAFLLAYDLIGTKEPMVRTQPPHRDLRDCLVKFRELPLATRQVILDVTNNAAQLIDDVARSYAANVKMRAKPSETPPDES